MRKLILLLTLLFSVPSNVIANLYFFEIKVLDEGIETLDYEISFEGKHYKMQPFWSNQNNFTLDTDYHNLDSNTVVIFKYKNKTYKINHLPTSIIQSSKIEINFSEDKFQKKEIRQMKNQILIIDNKFSFKMEGLNQVLYGNFCWRRNGKYSKQPYVPNSKVFLPRKLSGTSARYEH